MADHDEADEIDGALSSEEELQLLTEMSKCLITDRDSHEAIDDALRMWLDITTKLRFRPSDSPFDFFACAQMLLESEIFNRNKDYVRTQIIHSLLQEDEAGHLHAIASLLFLDGCADESVFPSMVEESCFSRLLELIVTHQEEKDPLLHRILLQLMYEMSRVQRLKLQDLALVNDDFVHSLFGIIEGVADDVHDPYHYPTIRVLLVLNEQYMMASTYTGLDSNMHPEPLTNRIVKCLSLHGPLYRTFGENVILLLNRETETSLQLLILKLLYLLFTTKATYEYFYTNDLQVLLDVIIRNLMDLPDEKISLRHTYLRVMYPLLAHTQLNQSPHYKREEILRALRILRGSHNAHFAPADETTLRLVDRVAKVNWIEENEASERGARPAELSRKFLGISLSPPQCASSISVGDVAGVMERPGIQTPSRHSTEAGDIGESVDTFEEAAHPSTDIKRSLPTVPRHRHGIPFAQAPKLHVTSNDPGKRVPPKAPPPRRWGRTRAAGAGQPPAEAIDEASAY
ncbi:hypothetical protein E4U30_002242 [Claviceps sp. LM220 group G6]|nr:hypothetical protein E4U15_003336 [Claviceps sp. LM218 group G6]KAG6095576.1 hypothetical protein E4U30_002242 [Claviceps sp. LM220 group G6]KAG6107421.1 hypothetical protein E4U31_000179 [Claviceps sp. LM219 group G6]